MIKIDTYFYKAKMLKLKIKDKIKVRLILINPYPANVEKMVSS
jgi:hypothetical protein